MLDHRNRLGQQIGCHHHWALAPSGVHRPDKDPVIFIVAESQIICLPAKTSKCTKCKWTGWASPVAFQTSHSSVVPSAGFSVVGLCQGIEPSIWPTSPAFEYSRCIWPVNRIYRYSPSPVQQYPTEVASGQIHPCLQKGPLFLVRVGIAGTFGPKLIPVGVASGTAGSSGSTTSKAIMRSVSPKTCGTGNITAKWLITADILHDYSVTRCNRFKVNNDVIT